MGYIRHHAIIVTGWNPEETKQAWEKAKSIFTQVSEIFTTETNGYNTFFIPPDGSKEGWDESNEGDARRKNFKDYLHAFAYEDGCPRLTWAEVQYADEEDDDRVVETHHTGVIYEDADESND